MAYYSQNKKRVALTAIMIALALIVAGNALYGSVYGRYKERENEINEKTDLIEKYKKIIKKSEVVKGKNNALKSLFLNVNSKMMIATSKAIASAKLQEKLKELTARTGINIASYKDLDPKEFGHYLRVGGQIVTLCQMRKLNDFLFAINNDELYLTVSDLNIKALSDPLGANVVMNIFCLVDTQKEETR